jgi:hypothetical protein
LTRGRSLPGFFNFQTNGGVGETDEPESTV